MNRTASTRGGQPLFSKILGSGLAVVLVAAAMGLTLGLQGIVSTAGYIFFYAAVVASAWFGGNWAGGLAVVLSTVLLDYLFVTPLHSLKVDRQSLPLFLEFAMSALLVGWFSSWRKRAEGALQQARDELQMRVEERTAELKQTNQQLVEEIAERKRAQDAYDEAQAELARVNRLNAMGALAASISHEVNQPLAAVVANADACAMWLSANPPNLDEARSAVDCVAREGTRASDVVRRIRSMFSKAGPVRAAVHLNELIREAGVLMEVQAARNQVALEFELAGDLPAAMGDRVQLQQVIVNLILNGIEAASEITDRPRQVTIRTQTRNPQEVIVMVQDSGIGIDPKNEKRIFNAFFTTKPQGMGMGLSICHSIVEAHGGRLWATANPGHGATLQFALPAAPQTA